jgi:hypothetical protein
MLGIVFLVYIIESYASSEVSSTEYVYGDNEERLFRNNIHSCPSGFAVTGFDGIRGYLLCSGFFGDDA